VDFKDDNPDEIRLDALQSKYVFAKVTVSVKVQKLADPEIVRTGQQKQEVHVADHSSTTSYSLGGRYWKTS
jgi:hypothetical protein